MNQQRRQDKPIEVTLPITPMLDMAFQLMFFFLATFNPMSQKEGQMGMSLPARRDPRVPAPEQVRPTPEPHKEEVEIPADVTISLRGFHDPRSKGQISALMVTTTAGSETLNGTEEQRAKLLREKLAARLPGTRDKDAVKKVPPARLEGEKDLRWSEVVGVMDVCYRAGFQVSFATLANLSGQ
jgi:biopolymer transport protein ExbD